MLTGGGDAGSASQSQELMLNAAAAAAAQPETGPSRAAGRPPTGRRLGDGGGRSVEASRPPLKVPRTACSGEPASLLGSAGHGMPTDLGASPDGRSRWLFEGLPQTAPRLWRVRREHSSTSTPRAAQVVTVGLVGSVDAPAAAAPAQLSLTAEVRGVRGADLGTVVPSRHAGIPLLPMRRCRALAVRSPRAIAVRRRRAPSPCAVRRRRACAVAVRRRRAIAVHHRRAPGAVRRVTLPCAAAVR